MSSTIRYTVPDAMHFLYACIQQMSDNELFRATREEGVVNFQYGAAKISVSRVGYTSENAARALPNIKYEIEVLGITYRPWIARRRSMG